MAHIKYQLVSKDDGNLVFRYAFCLPEVENRIQLMVKKYSNVKIYNLGYFIEEVKRGETNVYGSSIVFEQESVRVFDLTP